MNIVYVILVYTIEQVCRALWCCQAFFMQNDRSSNNRSRHKAIQQEAIFVSFRFEKISNSNNSRLLDMICSFSVT